MLQMKTNDGTKFTVTGDEAKDAMGTLKKVIYEHSVIAKTYNAVVKGNKKIDKVSRGVSELIRLRKGDDPMDETESINIKGVRRQQFEYAVRMLKDHPAWMWYHAADLAVQKVVGEDGYDTADSLHRYMLTKVTYMLKQGITRNPRKKMS